MKTNATSTASLAMITTLASVALLLPLAKPVEASNEKGLAIAPKSTTATKGGATSPSRAKWC